MCSSPQAVYERAPFHLLVPSESLLVRGWCLYELSVRIRAGKQSLVLGDPGVVSERRRARHPARVPAPLVRWEGERVGGGDSLLIASDAWRAEPSLRAIIPSQSARLRGLAGEEVRWSMWP